MTKRIKAKVCSHPFPIAREGQKPILYIHLTDPRTCISHICMEPGDCRCEPLCYERRDLSTTCQRVFEVQHQSIAMDDDI